MRLNKPLLLTLANLFILLSVTALSWPFGALAQEDVVLETDSEQEKHTVYFPQFQLFETVKNEMEMTGDITGRLDLADECLRVVTSQGSYLLVWPGWYDFAIDAREIVVTKINTSDVVGHLRIGSRVSFSGAELVYYPTTALQYKIPEQCPGPFWAVGEVQSARVEPEVIRESSRPAPRKIQKPEKAPDRITKIPFQPRRELPKKIRKPGQHQEMRKLEIMLEKTILK